MRQISILILVLALSGCAGSHWSSAWLNQPEKQSMENIQEEAMTALVEQAAKRLASHYPPGRTTLFLEEPKTHFRQRLEDGLRSHGFSFNSTQGGKNALNLYARLDAIQGEANQHWYLYVRLSDGFSFGNLYGLDEQDNFVAVGVMSQTPAFFELVDDGTSEPITAKTDEWRIRPGSLKSQMSSWAGRAGYRLVWSSHHDYTMHSGMVYQDTFVGAVKRLFENMQGAGNSLKVTLYRANKVFEVGEK